MLEKILIWLQPVGRYSLQKLLPMAVLAVVGVIVIHGVMKLMKRMLEKSKLEKAAHTLILTTGRVVLYVLLVLMVASGLGIDVTSLVALASVLTLAISLAVQNLLANVFGGFTLLYTKPFVSEDFVEIAGQSGTVKEIGLSYTKLATPDNKIVSIPNSAVVAAEIVNYTVTGTRRLDVNLEVSYQVDGETVLEILKTAAKQPKILEEPGVTVAIKEYNAQSITYGMMLWCKTEDYWELKYAINQELSKLSREAGISFHDPKLTVQMKQ